MNIQQGTDRKSLERGIAKGKEILERIESKIFPADARLNEIIDEMLAEHKIIPVLAFIRDYNQNKKSDEEGITKEEVAREMDKSGISSRPVTLRVIKNLLDMQIILNDPKKANAQSRLIVNPEFDFKQMELIYLISSIKNIREQFEAFNDETKGANTKLIDVLLRDIINFSEDDTGMSWDQGATYKTEQTEKIELDHQKQILKKTKKRG